MDIWIKRCNKEAMCVYCRKPITKGSMMVVGKLWLGRDKVTKELKPRRFIKMLYWHAENSEGRHCWEEQGINHAKSVPVVETRGRKKLPLPPEQAVLRRKLLIRRGSILQSINHELESDCINTDRLIHLGHRLEDLKTQISLCGGIPPGWTVPQGTTPPRKEGQPSCQ